MTNMISKNKKLKDDGESSKAFDDGIDKLTADEYIKTRLIPVLVSFQNKPGNYEDFSLVYLINNMLIYLVKGSICYIDSIFF